jgi:hypothetical protein
MLLIRKRFCIRSNTPLFPRTACSFHCESKFFHVKLIDCHLWPHAYVRHKLASVVRGQRLLQSCRVQTGAEANGSTFTGQRDCTKEGLQYGQTPARGKCRLQHGQAHVQGPLLHHDDRDIGETGEGARCSAGRTDRRNTREYQHNNTLAPEWGAHENRYGRDEKEHQLIL